MMRTVVFLLLSVSLTPTGQAQGRQPEGASDVATEEKPVKAAETSSAFAVSLSSSSPKPEVKRQVPKVFFLTSAGVYSAAFLDMHNTRSEMNFCKRQPGYVCYENNPLARPLVGLPTPAYYATGLALTTGVNWLSWKMSRREKFRRVWFLPQILSMAANGWGYASSAKLRRAN